MNRRGFLYSILAAGVAPAIVRVESLMPVKAIQIATIPEILQISGKHGIINTGSLPRALWPGIEKYWKEYYESLGVWSLDAGNDTIPHA